MKPIVVARYRLKMVNFLFSILLGIFIMIRYSEAVVDECSEEYFFSKTLEEDAGRCLNKIPFSRSLSRVFSFEFYFYSCCLEFLSTPIFSCIISIILGDTYLFKAP